MCRYRRRAASAAPPEAGIATKGTQAAETRTRAGRRARVSARVSAVRRPGRSRSCSRHRDKMHVGDIPAHRHLIARTERSAALAKRPADEKLVRRIDLETILDRFADVDHLDHTSAHDVVGLLAIGDEARPLRSNEHADLATRRE